MNMITESKRNELVARIRPLCKQVESWRKMRAGNEPMPKPLWEAATELAKVYGVSPVQRILRIDYRGLERRALGTGKPHPKPRPRSQSFVELPPLAPLRRAEQTLELEDGAGRRMTIKVCGGNLAEALPLAQAFWRPAL
jgi:hypothetical protein